MKSFQNYINKILAKKIDICIIIFQDNILFIFTKCIIFIIFHLSFIKEKILNL